MSDPESTLHPFLDAVTNELDGYDWQTVDTAVSPIDPDEFAECWLMLEPTQQAQAEPAWLAFLAMLATGERDRIDKALSTVCEVLGINPPANDPDSEVDARASELADRLLEVTDDPHWYQPHLAPESAPDVPAQPASIVDRLPLASGLDDTQPGHSAKEPAEPAPLPLLVDLPDWAPPDLDLDSPEPEANHARVETVELDHAESSAERQPAPDWQAEYRQLAHALATRNPWRVATACLAVVFVLFIGAGLYEYERARTESATLRAQLAERALDSAPVAVPVVDAPARMIPVDAAASRRVEHEIQVQPGQVYSWIVEDEAIDWRFTGERIERARPRPRNHDAVVIPESQLREGVSLRFISPDNELQMELR